MRKQQKLSAADNQINHIELGEKHQLEMLEVLNLKNNRIERIGKLNINFPNLYDLNISDNHIISLSDLNFTRRMDHLIQVEFQGNMFVNKE